MSEITWIKLKTDMFDNQKIKLIEALPEGDTILIIWIKLLAYAGKTNANGFILINEDIALSVEEMAIIFNRQLNVVRLALEAFKRYGMISLHNDVIRIKNWDVYQNVEGMERAKQLNAERNRKYRERKKLEIPMFEEQSDVSVTSRDAIDIDKELDIDIDIDIERDKDKEIKDKENIPFSKIVKYLNEKCFTKYRASSEKTKTLIKARWNEGFKVEDFQRVIDIKSTQWINDDKMSQYLRPETLFGTKFESYLNERVVKLNGQNGRDSGQAPGQNESVLQGRTGWINRSDI